MYITLQCHIHAINFFSKKTVIFPLITRTCMLPLLESFVVICDLCFHSWFVEIYVLHYDFTNHNVQYLLLIMVVRNMRTTTHIIIMFAWTGWFPHEYWVLVWILAKENIAGWPHHTEWMNQFVNNKN